MIEQHIFINNKHIAYWICCSEFANKQKPFLVFLHEGLGSSQQWKDIPEELCRKLGLPALLYDRIGYGRSQSIEGKRTKDFLQHEAFFLRDFLREAGISIIPPILIGHSDGGTISALYASFFPYDVTAVILIAPHFFLEPTTLQSIRELCQRFDTGDLKEKLARQHGDKTETMFRSWVDVWLDPEMESWNIEHEIKSIRCPLMGVQGYDDTFGTMRQLYALYGIPSPKTFLMFHRVGHFPHLEMKKTFIHQCDVFIRKVVSSVH